MAIIRRLEPKDRDENSLADTDKHSVPRMKRFKQDHDDSNWLISYADMMTLLCVFYIMMFSMAKVNTAEFEKVKKEVSERLGGKYTSPTESLGKTVKQALVNAKVDNQATVTSDGVSVSIAFHSTLFFDSMSAEISPAGKAVLVKIANTLAAEQKKIGQQYKFVVEGHTDSQPILEGPFPSNWELSSGRATRVVRLFIENGFAPTNMLAIGYADTQPEVEARNANGTWNQEKLAKNRRVVFARALTGC